MSLAEHAELAEKTLNHPETLLRELCVLREKIFVGWPEAMPLRKGLSCLVRQ